MSDQPVPAYAGERLGLPAEGPGSVAGWGRRIVAIFVDWFASLLVTRVVVAAFDLDRTADQWLPLGVFLLEAALFTALMGGSFGQLVVRIAVIRLDGRPLSLFAALLRTTLVCLVVPPLVFNRDNRGLHDLAVGSIALRR